MALQRKHKCPWHTDDEYVRECYPHNLEHPEWCPWCHGTLYTDHDVRLSNHQGEFKSVDWEKISNFEADITMSFNCQCGDRIFSMGEEDVACSCGRVYRYHTVFQVDETYLGKPEVLIEEDIKDEEERHKQWEAK